MTTATVLTDEPQADGRRRITVEFDSGTGLTWRKDWLIAQGAVAQTEADAKIPAEEAIQEAAERDRAYGIATDSQGDPDLETWHYNTLADIRKYVFRRIYNLMRDEVNDPTKAIVCGVLADPASYMNKHNNSAISGFVDDPAWTVPTVGDANNKISAVGVNIPLLDHGETELSLEF